MAASTPLPERLSSPALSSRSPSFGYAGAEADEDPGDWGFPGEEGAAEGASSPDFLDEKAFMRSLRLTPPLTTSSEGRRIFGIHDVVRSAMREVAVHYDKATTEAPLQASRDGSDQRPRRP